MPSRLLSRRRFAFVSAISTAGLHAQNGQRIPVGLQQSAVLRNLQQNFDGTLRAIAGMGYDTIEFSANTFMTWTPARAKEVRALLDEIHLPCRSTHNEIVSFSGDGLSKAIELNLILGSDTMVSVRGPGTPAAPATLDAWKRFSEHLSTAADRIRAARMTLGFHNHDVEFKPLEGSRPIDILAANKDIASFHLNIGLCLKGGGDPVAFIRQCPGRIQSLLIQDYMNKANWKEILPAAEKTGGLQFYLIQRTDGLFLVERQGDDLLDHVKKDLAYFRQLRASAVAAK
jgi:sugar phosphate isomerase/epimerase